MSDVVARAKAALEGVTEGPWEVSRWEDFGGNPSFYIEDIEQFKGYRNSVNFGSDKALADFVAASRQLVSELIAEVERLRAGGPVDGTPTAPTSDD